MVTAVSFFKRRAGMDVEEFRAYWRTRHPEVVMKLSGVHRYVQSHTRLGAYRDGEPVHDGIAELWFEDTAAIRALRDTPEMAAVQADEARFIDRSTMGSSSPMTTSSRAVPPCRGWQGPGSRRAEPHTAGGLRSWA